MYSQVGGFLKLLVLYIFYKGVDNMLEHRKIRESAVLWFILALIPIINFYVLYKMAVLIANHQDK